ncbi:hypothetical protein [Thiorhodovibrio frisius]|uniref:Uncharacterized protein n=1 Tax=Thiorhodovibrio frisius TaxID=631362 RepID=H8Z0S6_9GAMM|nr:hypothetical protein [Thiorhodovibrio frisius]EIC21308.1 hypothetical protein Thi970DRAFT_01511 [Thiorhodovibrio frisius]WPL23891.1 hypothetical protein Thiofri_04100 [Thiorhodovibrio frisius]
MLEKKYTSRTRARTLVTCGAGLIKPDAERIEMRGRIDSSPFQYRVRASSG